MALMGRWWNGKYGRLVRRDIWLSRETVWQVRARDGDAETGRELQWQFTSEEQARAMVERLKRADRPDEWRDLTGLVTGS